MEHLVIYERPTLRDPPLVIAFGGWPDAGEGATGAVRYLVRKLSAKKFAEILPEEFYDFTQTRPLTLLAEDGSRFIRWPANEFFYWKNKGTGQDCLFVVGVEPNLRWKTYATTVMNLAEECGSRMALHLGALLDAVPHTREPRLSGSANKAEWRARLESLDIYSSDYQGPTGVSSAIMEICNSKGYVFASVWGHSPHYLQASPNFKISYSLLNAVNNILQLPVELEELKANASRFQDAVQNAVSQDSQINAYVQQLEREYDQAQASGRRPMPSPKAVVEELEKFLRDQQRRHGEGPPDQP